MKYSFRQRLPMPGKIVPSSLVDAAARYDPRVIASNAIECLIKCATADTDIEFYLYWEYSGSPELLSNSTKIESLHQICEDISMAIAD
jgi:hypothetical protein